MAASFLKQQLPHKTSFRDFPAPYKEVFFKAGIKKRHFFPHQSYFLPRCGPDGFKSAGKTVQQADPNQLWEVVLYADQALLAEFPEDLFFDDDLVWHQQHLGISGQIASANLVIVSDRLYTNNHVSDIVQRISRRRTFKTRIETLFKGWPYMLLNSILNFAREKQLREICLPTADYAIENTDIQRTVKRDLFHRIYDWAVTQHFNASQEGNWWVINLNDNISSIAIGEKKETPLPSEKTICIYHDTERGLGHIGIDNDLAKFADRMAPNYLQQMLAAEAAVGVKASYNVVGQFLSDIRAEIEAGGHGMAFHSFNHRVSSFWSFLNKHPRLFTEIHKLLGKLQLRNAGNQLYRCRTIDYRLKGYRPPQSVLTGELSDTNLCYHNFEWLGCWIPPQKARLPYLENRLVKIPMQLDDWPIYCEKVSYTDWEKAALNTVQENEFTAIGLHDCYAQYWIDHYESFLRKLGDLGELKTIESAANNIFLRHAF